MKTEGLMVVPDHHGRAGSVTWWRLQGSVNYDRLIAVWARHGFPEADLPPPPSDAAALRRTLEAFRGPQTLVRAVPTGGFAVVDEEYNEADEVLEYETRFTVWIDYESSSMTFDREVDDDVANSVIESFERLRRELQATDLSAWMVRRAKALSAIALRDTGGIYFVPEPSAEAWSVFADVVAEVSASRVYELPALKTERAVEALMDAVLAEASEEAAKLEEAIDALDAAPSARAVKAKAAKCEAIATKLELYEDLLGRRVGDVGERLARLEARIVEASLVTA